MKQKVSPAAFISVVVVGLLAIVGIAVWVFRAPSVSVVVPPPQGEGLAGMTTPQKEAGERGPSPEQLEQIREWKKKNPGAATQY